LPIGLGIGDWGLGIGFGDWRLDWGLGIGDLRNNPQSPIGNRPIGNPQSPIQSAIGN
jgi:hypothetical protein